uniref:Uncharacterized protein n=1 Tax=Glossina brevipalpis TaxID=37001 RepID=A0A1A9W5A6_9MUSC
MPAQQIRRDTKSIYEKISKNIFRLLLVPSIYRFDACMAKLREILYNIGGVVLLQLLNPLVNGCCTALTFMSTFFMKLPSSSVFKHYFMKDLCSSLITFSQYSYMIIN